MHTYEVEPRKDKRGVDLISDALPFGRLWYDTPANAIGYAMHSSRSPCISLLQRVGRFLPLTGKRAYRPRDFAEPVQTQSRVWGPCLRLRPVNHSHGALSPCTK